LIFFWLFDAFPKTGGSGLGKPVRLVSLKLDDRIFCESRLIGSSV
jgi:hypothetical protein